MDRNRKKIIYLITKANWGGAQKYVFDLATSLVSESRRANFPKGEFDVLVVHGEGNILNKRLQESGVRTKAIPEMGRDINPFLEIISFFKILLIFLRERPQIVHVNSSKAGGVGAFVARIIFVPKIIFTVHGWAFNEERFNNLLTKFFSWLTIILSTETIVISKQNFEQGLEFPYTKNKLILIYNGVKEADFRKRASARKFLADMTGANSKKPWLVTISELHKNKGLSYLIEAISKIKEKPIVFVLGEGEERDNLENLIKKLGLRKNIFLMGFIEGASSYLKAFDIFTLTSIKEGHPYTILEAGLAKLPVIGSDIPGINDIIDNKTGLLFEPKNSKDLALKIGFLLKNKKNTAQLGQNLHNKITEEFSFEKMFEQTISLY